MDCEVQGYESEVWCSLNYRLVGDGGVPSYSEVYCLGMSYVAVGFGMLSPEATGSLRKARTGGVLSKEI
jgi:hypothetical protein